MVIAVYAHEMSVDMPQSPARWTVSVNPATDAALRAFIGVRDGRKGDLSKFIEEAVLWRMLDQAAQKARDGFTDLSEQRVQQLVEEACSAVDPQLFAPTASVK